MNFNEDRPVKDHIQPDLPPLNREMRRALGAQSVAEALENFGNDPAALMAAVEGAQQKIATRRGLSGKFVEHPNDTHVPK